MWRGWGLSGIVGPLVLSICDADCCFSTSVGVDIETVRLTQSAAVSQSPFLRYCLFFVGVSLCGSCRFH